MGYHLTILRTSEGKPIEISLESAIQAALTLKGWKYSASPSPTFTFSHPLGVVTLWYDNEELWTKSQGTEWELEPMITLAKTLDARVRGDELETYESPDKTYFHPDDVALNAALEIEGAALVKKHLREQKRIRNFIIGFFIILGIIAFFIGKQFEH